MLHFHRCEVFVAQGDADLVQRVDGLPGQGEGLGIIADRIPQEGLVAEADGEIARPEVCLRQEAQAVLLRSQRLAVAALPGQGFRQNRIQDAHPRIAGTAGLSAAAMAWRAVVSASRYRPCMDRASARFRIVLDA